MKETPEPTTRKKVDESWKETVRKEQETPASDESGPETLPPPNFSFFISTLGMQALAALGQLKDPDSNEASPPDLKQAQSLIDILEMLSEKTRGNLSPEENDLLENLLYELRMKYVQKSRAV